MFCLPVPNFSSTFFPEFSLGPWWVSLSECSLLIIPLGCLLLQILRAYITFGAEVGLEDVLDALGRGDVDGEGLGGASNLGLGVQHGYGRHLE